MNALRKKLSMDRLVKRRGVQSVQYNYLKEAIAVVHVRVRTKPSESSWRSSHVVKANRVSSWREGNFIDSLLIIRITN